MAGLYRNGLKVGMSHPHKLVTGSCARGSPGLSAMYGAEVPAYGTLVEVSEEANRDYSRATRAPNGLGRWSGSPPTARRDPGRHPA